MSLGASSSSGPAARNETRVSFWSYHKRSMRRASSNSPPRRADGDHPGEAGLGRPARAHAGRAHRGGDEARAPRQRRDGRGSRRRGGRLARHGLPLFSEPRTVDRSDRGREPRTGAQLRLARARRRDARARPLRPDVPAVQGVRTAAARRPAARARTHGAREGRAIAGGALSPRAIVAPSSRAPPIRCGRRSVRATTRAC